MEAIDSTLKNSLDWLDSHQSEDYTAYNDKQSEVEGVIKPIITKLYEAAGGTPDTSSTPDAGGFGSSEANVEEVD